MSVYERLKELGVELPSTLQSVGWYLPALRVGDMVWTSGQLPLRDGQLIYRGKLGEHLSVTEGQEAARLCVLNALKAIESVVGSLDSLRRVVRLVGYVASAEHFTEQPQVLNGASQLLLDLFGEAGKHVRSAVGVRELPLGAPAEVELFVLG